MIRKENCISCVSVSNPSKHLLSAYCVQSVLGPPSACGIRGRMVRPAPVASEHHIWVAYGPWEETTALVTLVQVAGGWMAINEQIKCEFLAWGL